MANSRIAKDTVYKTSISAGQTVQLPVGGISMIVMKKTTNKVIILIDSGSNDYEVIAGTLPSGFSLSYNAGDGTATMTRTAGGPYFPIMVIG